MDDIVEGCLTLLIGRWIMDLLLIVAVAYGFFWLLHQAGCDTPISGLLEEKEKPALAIPSAEAEEDAPARPEPTKRRFRSEADRKYGI